MTEKEKKIPELLPEDGGIRPCSGHEEPTKATKNLVRPSGKAKPSPVEARPEGFVGKAAATEPEPHEIEVMLTSPFLTYADRSMFPVAAAAEQGVVPSLVVDPSKVRAYGTASAPSDLAINTRGAGPGSLGLTIDGPTEARFECVEKGPGLFGVRYWPTEPGEYTTNILCDDKPIPHSPSKAQVNRTKLVDVSGIKTYGPGLEPTGVCLDLVSEFTVDAKSVIPIGEGIVKVLITNASGTLTEGLVTNKRDGTYECLYTAVEQGPTKINVSYDGIHVPNSPFAVDARPGVDASAVRVYGPGAHKPATIFQRPSGSRDVEFTPESYGPHQFDVTFGGQPFADSPDVETESDSEEAKTTPQSVQRVAGSGECSTASKRDQQDYAKDSLEEPESEVSLFDIVKSGKIALTTVIDNWIEVYKEDRDMALLDLFQFFINSSGCKGRIASDTYHIMEHTKIIQKMTEEFYEKSDEYPLIMSGPQWEMFQTNFCGFISVLIRQCQYSIIYDQYMMDNIILVLTSLIDSQVRAFRHTSTLASLKLMTSLVEVALNLSIAFENTRLQYESKRTNSKGKHTSDRLKMLMIEEKQEEIQHLFNRLFKGVFVHRYRDSQPEIRGICTNEFGVWIKRYPSMFFDNSYLKCIIGWSLYDQVGYVRLCALRCLQPLYDTEKLVPKLESFTNSFKDRVVEMTHDKEYDVAVQALQLLTTILKTSNEPVPHSSHTEPPAYHSLGKMPITGEFESIRWMAGDILVSRMFSNSPSGRIVGKNIEMANDDSPGGLIEENSIVEEKEEELKMFFILDTNIFFEKFGKFIFRIHTWMKKQPSTNLMVYVVPWTVLQELDHIKDGRQSNKSKKDAQNAAKFNDRKEKAQRAIKVLNRQLGSKDSFVVGEHPREAAEAQAMMSGYKIEGNDDKILHTCLFFQKKYSVRQVVLLTLDNNMINKANVMGINAFTKKSLNIWLQNKYPSFSPSSAAENESDSESDEQPDVEIEAHCGLSDQSTHSHMQSIKRGSKRPPSVDTGNSSSFSKSTKPSKLARYSDSFELSPN